MINLLSLGTVTSGFGLREQPIAGASTNHKGIDIVLKDYNIPAVLGGTITESGYNNTMGNYVKVRQSDGTTATYMHMATPSSYLRGMKISEGATIGVMGSTGASTGDHVHYQVQSKDGSYLDPAEYLRGGVSLPSGNLDETTFELSGVMGSITSFSAMLLLCFFAVILFLKAFDIKIL